MRGGCSWDGAPSLWCESPACAAPNQPFSSQLAKPQPPPFFTTPSNLAKRLVCQLPPSNQVKNFHEYMDRRFLLRHQLLPRVASCKRAPGRDLGLQGAGVEADEGDVVGEGDHVRVDGGHEPDAAGGGGRPGRVQGGQARLGARPPGPAPGAGPGGRGRHAGAPAGGRRAGRVVAGRPPPGAGAGGPSGAPPPHPAPSETAPPPPSLMLLLAPSFVTSRPPQRGFFFFAERASSL